MVVAGAKWPGKSKEMRSNIPRFQDRHKPTPQHPVCATGHQSKQGGVVDGSLPESHADCH